MRGGVDASRVGYRPAMPSLRQQRSPSRALDPSPAPTTTASAGRGNAAEQARIQPGAGGDAGLADYRAALGDFLGSELHGAVQDVLTMDKVKAVGDAALAAAIEAATGALSGAEGVDADPQAVAAIAGILQAEAGARVEAWLAGEGAELVARLKGWAGANPQTVATVAILAAAGAALANAPLPELKRKLKVGEGGELELEARLGRIRSISLERLRAKLSHTAGPLVGAVEVTHQGGKTAGGASATLSGEGRKLTLEGKADEEGLSLLGLRGEIETFLGQVDGGVKQARGEGAIGEVRLARTDGATKSTGDFRYDAGAGRLTVGASALWEGDGLTAGGAARWGSDGARSVEASLAAKHGETEATGKLSHAVSGDAYGLTEENKAELGLRYTRDDLKVALDAMISTSGASSAGVSVEKDLGEDRRVGGDAKWAGGALLEAGAFYGFRDPKEFRTFLAEYRYKAGVDEHTFGLLVERRFGDVLARWKQTAAWGTGGSRLDSSVHFAKPVGEDTALIAGATHQRDFATGRNTFRPEVGVQVKGVPVLVGYDTDRGQVTIGITLPFGR